MVDLGPREGIRQKDEEERRDGEEQLGQWIPRRSIPFSLPPTRAVGDPCTRVSHPPLQTEAIPTGIVFLFPFNTK